MLNPAGNCGLKNNGSQKLYLDCNFRVENPTGKIIDYADNFGV